MSNEINHAAAAVLREALDNVDVHPFDFSNDEVRAKGLYGPMAQLYQALWRPTPSSANGVEGLPELPEPFDMDMPELHTVGLGCGVEDRSIHDRYEAAEYGWRECYDAFVQVIPVIYTAEQMQAYARAAVLAERAACEKACADSFTGFGGPIDDPAQESILINGAIRDCITAIRARK